MPRLNAHNLYSNFTTQAEIDAQYNASAAVPDAAAYRRHYADQAKRARETLPCALDVSFGALLAGQIHEILRKYLRCSGLKIGGRVCGHGFRYTLDVKTHESATCASLGSKQAVWFDVRDVRMGAECFQGRFRRRFVSNLDPSAIMKTHGKLSE